MSSPFVAEIRPFAFNFAPRGWAACNGQLLAISQFTAVFSLLGTNFGGNGTSNFGLPNLQGATPMHWGNGAGLTPRVIGETGGTSTVTLIQSEMPQHNHTFQVAEGGTVSNAPDPTVWLGQASPGKIYALTGTPSVTLAGNAVSNGGGSTPHENSQPYLTINMCIALQGIFPSRN
ncbi:MAG TPA: tail fiber protein [Caulobacteraceae bacterium]|nr:tail fiber protein [Caulobacteraceae bacterium]